MNLWSKRYILHICSLNIVCIFWYWYYIRVKKKRRNKWKKGKKKYCISLKRSKWHIKSILCSQLFNFNRTLHFASFSLSLLLLYLHFTNESTHHTELHQWQKSQLHIVFLSLSFSFYHPIHFHTMNLIFVIVLLKCNFNLIY